MVDARDIPLTTHVAVCCRPLDVPLLSDEEASAAATLFKALADPTRVRLVNLLATTGARCVCELVEPLGLTQPTVSHHLKKLTDAGLLEREQRGVWAYYTLNREALGELASLVELTEVST